MFVIMLSRKAVINDRCHEEIKKARETNRIKYRRIDPKDPKDL